MSITDQIQKDSIVSEGIRISKSVTFDGGTLNGIGDIDGTSNPYTLFTVTGAVAVRVLGHCTTNITDGGGTATVSLGISGNVASLIAVTTAVDIDANEIWIDATPATTVSLPGYSVLVNGTDIELNCLVENVTGGIIVFYCTYIPLSSDGVVS